MNACGLGAPRASRMERRRSTAETPRRMASAASTLTPSLMAWAASPAISAYSSRSRSAGSGSATGSGAAAGTWMGGGAGSGFGTGACGAACATSDRCGSAALSSATCSAALRHGRTLFGVGLTAARRPAGDRAPRHLATRIGVPIGPRDQRVIATRRDRSRHPSARPRGQVAIGCESPHSSADDDVHLDRGSRARSGSAVA
jgi:hypothetical protein